MASVQDLLSKTKTEEEGFHVESPAYLSCECGNQRFRREEMIPQGDLKTFIVNLKFFYICTKCGKEQEMKF